ncbi:2-hydroxyacid dehydrogenase [Natronogracilivirga saccharolytica]|uniref:D-glycerate dehydrogenase n=1 Tax=Natronogracilivirga saccharolytica TaxID=2812953 RepID=A0A8J7USX8_9BACT|nr:D-glycerate dehydrogenase [Natronogracilivirga saccharolytica]MBP3192021.1 D-glycerate dehydrogenase [Natronogracilivirga saccharolytica]
MRILVTEPLPGKGIDLLSSRYDTTVGERGEFDGEEHLKNEIGSYDALLSCLSNPVTADVLRSAPQLRIVSNYAVGYNNIDIETARELGILVANTPDVLTEATADCAFALLLSVARRLREAEDHLRAGKFDGWHPFGFLGTELHGKKAGILGMGRIGRAFARRARGFGMTVLYHNRNRLDTKTETSLQAQYVESIDQLAEQSDVLSLHCPLNDETRHAVNSERLGRMKPDAIVINTSRGPVIDESALADALHQKQIGGAGLDVFEEEPRVHPSLADAPNCVLLPHIGSATGQTRARMSALAASSIISHLEGKPDHAIPSLVFHR